MRRIAILLIAGFASLAAAERPRVLVLTDIGGDPDDQQSMRRLMLYSNEFAIQGLIASARGVAGQFAEPDPRPELIDEIIDDYEQVRPRLQRHAEGFPAAKALRQAVAAGSPQRGVAYLGQGRATAGSRRIIAAVDASDRPLYAAIWGGAHDLAQALDDVRRQRSAAQLAGFLAKLRVYAISDQDGKGDAAGTGAWIRENFPTLRYVEAGPPGTDRFSALFRGMYQNDARGNSGPAVPLVRESVAVLNQEPWLREHVLSGHGTLGAGYPVVRQNPSSPRNTAGVKEGDTPSWFYVLPVGLSDPEQPGYGGWGGRFVHDAGGHWTDAQDEHWSGSADVGLRQKWTVARWRDAYQNDFAARMDWCVAERFADANHPPRPTLNGDASGAVLTIRAPAGQTLELSAAGSSDPDGDELSFYWFVYAEASSYSNPVALEAADAPTARVTIPADAAGQEIHVILEATDNGTPPLTRYRRVVVRATEE